MRFDPQRLWFVSWYRAHALERHCGHSWNALRDAQGQCRHQRPDPVLGQGLQDTRPAQQHDRPRGSPKTPTVPEYGRRGAHQQPNPQRPREGHRGRCPLRIRRLPYPGTSLKKGRFMTSRYKQARTVQPELVEGRHLNDARWIPAFAGMTTFFCLPGSGVQAGSAGAAYISPASGRGRKSSAAWCS